MARVRAFTVCLTVEVERENEVRPQTPRSTEVPETEASPPRPSSPDMQQEQILRGLTRLCPQFTANQAYALYSDYTAILRLDVSEVVKDQLISAVSYHHCSRAGRGAPT